MHMLMVLLCHLVTESRNKQFLLCSHHTVCVVVLGPLLIFLKTLIKPQLTFCPAMTGICHGFYFNGVVSQWSFVLRTGSADIHECVTSKDSLYEGLMSFFVNSSVKTGAGGEECSAQRDFV